MRFTSGKEYLETIGFKSTAGYENVLMYLKDQIGYTKAKGIIDVIQTRAKRKGCFSRADDGLIYTKKNKSLKISMAVTAAYETQALTNICDYIIAHADVFKGTVLDIGCDCGILSCFIAAQFPECTVVGIDRCALAIPNAEELANTLDLSNVSFSCKALDRLTETFDVVLSSRTLMENITVPAFSFRNSAEQIAEIHRNAFEAYAMALAQHVNDGGYLVSIERLSPNPGTWGWLEALQNSHLTIWNSTSRYLINDDDIFFACISKKNSTPMEPAEDFYKEVLSSVTIPIYSIYESFEAMNMLYLYAGKLIKGYCGYDSRGEKVFSGALYECLGDKTTMLYECHMGEMLTCARVEYSSDSLQRCLQTMRNDIVNLLKSRKLQKITEIASDNNSETDVTI